MGAYRSAGRRRDAFAAAAEDAGSATTRGRAAAAGEAAAAPAVEEPGRFRRLALPEDAATPSSRFVNKVRGGGRGGAGLPPEISLDDLADEFFRARAESEDDDDEEEAVVVVRGEESRGRLRFPAPAEKGGGRRSSTARYARETESSRQRGRSVSRPPAERRGGATAVANGGAAAAGRQRYASVDRRASMDRHRWCDSDVSVTSISQSNSQFLVVIIIIVVFGFV